MSVWGHDYIDQFIGISLPTILAEGNLLGLPHLAESKFLIFTSEEGREQLQWEPLFQRLESLIEVEFVFMDALISSRKFDTANVCQQEGIARSLDYDALFFVYPDFVWSAGSFSNIVERLEQGYKGLMCPIPRLSSDSFSVAFSNKLKQLPSNEFSLAGSEFVAFCDPHFHHIMETYEVGQPTFSSFPSQLSWKIAGSGRLFHCYHTHPIAIQLDNQNNNLLYRFSISLDEDYISNLFMSSDQLYIASDSDEIAVCSLTPDEFSIHSTSRFKNDHIIQLWIWAERYAALLHRSMVRRGYRWHYDSTSTDDWREAEERAIKLIESIGSLLAMPDKQAEWECQSASLARSQRRKLLKKRKKYGSLVRYLFEPINVNQIDKQRVMLRVNNILMKKARYVVTIVFNVVPFSHSGYLKMKKLGWVKHLSQWKRMRYSPNQLALMKSTLQVPLYVEIYNILRRKTKTFNKLGTPGQ